MKKQWGVISKPEEVEATKQIVESANLEMLEARELSILEKFMYCGKYVTNMWIVMFYATDDECNVLLNRNNLAAVC